MGVRWEGWREDGREKLSRKKLRLNRIMQSHICDITQLVTSCNNDVIFIFGTSTLQSHLRFPLPPPQCIKSQDFTGAGPQSHLQCHWPHLQEDRGGPDHWTGQYDL